MFGRLFFKVALIEIADALGLAFLLSFLTRSVKSRNMVTSYVGSQADVNIVSRYPLPMPRVSGAFFITSTLSTASIFPCR